jgi:galactose-1-phosphate uridylyltransferase
MRLLDKQEMQYKEVHDKLMKQDSKHKADKEYKIQADEMKLMKDKMKTQADESKKQAVVAKMKGDQLRQNIIDDLAADNIIQDKKHVSFQLNNEEMIVNGVKQPEKVFRKFKEKYGKSPETKIGFTYSDN